MVRKRTEWLQFGSGKSYFHRVHRPLQCLIFITPLLLFYQVGSAILPWTPNANAAASSAPQVVAFVLMLRFFGFFGVAGNYFPLLAVVAILISWHIARKDPWEFEPKLYAGMFGEAIVWAIPFVIIGLAVMRRPTGGLAMMAASPADQLSVQSEIVLSVGAGVYEELLFRLIAITILNIILVDIFEMKIQAAIPVIIVASAVMFSAYHYLGRENFAMGIFIFRTALGIYFAGIYIYRGFGIAVGTHAVYDLIAVAIQHHQGH